MLKKMPFGQSLLIIPRRMASRQQEEFYQSGKNEIETVWALLKSINALPPQRDKALDFGCGTQAFNKGHCIPYLWKE